MPRKKMIPALSGPEGESEHDRFKRFAKAVLAVPKSEITPAEEALAKLQDEKQKIDAKLAEVRLELAKRKANRSKGT